MPKKHHHKHEDEPEPMDPVEQAKRDDERLEREEKEFEDLTGGRD